MQALTLPAGYRPFPELVLCSNRLVNVAVPIALYGQIPFLVGMGLDPLLWLRRPSPNNEFVWQELVMQNAAQQDGVEVCIKRGEGVGAQYGHMPLIRVLKRSDQIAEIELLDFRPVGLDIYGDDGGLHVGARQFSERLIQHQACMLQLG